MLNTTEKRHWQSAVKSPKRLLLVDGHLVVAGLEMELWNLKTGKLHKTLLGHATPVVDLCANHDQTMVVSCAQQDRSISVWKIEGKETAAVHVLSCDDVPVALRTSHGHQGVLAVTDAGRGVVYNSLDAKNGATLVFKASESSAVIPLLCASWVDVGKEMHVYTARGLAAKPVFEQVTLVDDALVDGTFIFEQQLNAHAQLINEQGMQNKVTKKAAGGRANVIGTEDIPIPLSVAQESMDTDAPTTNTLTMEERLAKLQNKSTITNGTASVARQPKANSLLAVILQALKTNDKHMLESSLQHGNQELIHNTVQRMPSQHVPQFLDQLIERFRSSPQRATQLSIWIRAVLTYHASYLMHIKDTSTKLAGLHRAITVRSAVHDKLLGLHGRLQMLTSMMDMQKRPQGRGQGEHPVVYKDQEEEEVEMDSGGSEEEESDEGEDGMDVDEEAESDVQEEEASDYESDE